MPNRECQNVVEGARGANPAAQQRERHQHDEPFDENVSTRAPDTAGRRSDGRYLPERFVRAKQVLISVLSFFRAASS
jgi:hypothetical protein